MLHGYGLSRGMIDTDQQTSFAKKVQELKKIGGIGHLEKQMEGVNSIIEEMKMKLSQVTFRISRVSFIETFLFTGRGCTN